MSAMIKGFDETKVEIVIGESGNPDIDSVNRFYAIARRHDDRGLVLSLSAFAEDSLGRLLLTYLKEGKPSRELVEGFNAPLGTLSTRIKAAHALGLLSREQYDRLELARRIRNKFAHDWEGCSLERQDIKAMIGKLRVETFDGTPFVGSTRERLMASIFDVLIEIRVLTGSFLKSGTRVPSHYFELRFPQPAPDPSL